MALNTIPLTLLVVGSKSLPLPVTKWFLLDKIQDYDTDIAIGTKIFYQGKSYEVAETPMEMEALGDMNSTDPEIIKTRNLAQLGNLAVQATGTAITKFLTEFDDVVGTTKEAATLDAATVGKVRRVINNDANVDLLLFPATDENFLGSADDAKLPADVPFGTAVALYCAVAGTWLVVA